eukprot:TRINITY_DN2006_c0_g1_i2.p2 TRINITY_DN2006_c0_g1~~TRINITY_DN2006_c0_g1_i2.p2  ORF type:complete len:350 (-),score=97.70 TRINITY_DN2006_c0_g1_i2:1715-2764(-)
MPALPLDTTVVEASRAACIALPILACVRARALQAAIDKTADTTEWEALRLELCILLWLAQYASRHLHLKGQEGWYPLPRSLQGSGGGVAEEMDLTEQEDERPQEDAIDLTAAHVLPPATLFPQERKLLTDQLQKLLARVQSPPPTKPQLFLLVDEYLRFMDLKRAAPPESLSPSAAIDDVWLSHVVCTSAYAAFCERHFGAFVDHEPTRPSIGRYQACLEAYRRHYNSVPPPSCWPEPPEADDAAAAAAASSMTAHASSVTGGGDGGGGGNAEGASTSSTPVVAADAATAGAHQPRAAHSEAAADTVAAEERVSLAAGSHIQMPLQDMILTRPRADLDGGGAATMQQVS